MDSFYIFQYCPNPKNSNDFTLVIYCSGQSISHLILRDKIKVFFETNRPPKKIVIIGGEFLRDELVRVFTDDSESVLDVIPNFLTREKGLQLVVFNEKGEFNTIDGNEFENSELLIQQGIFNIFKTREGIIRAASENYHFVFPSGKHCTFFIRAGNILIHSAEISFISIPLLRHLEQNVNTIYCDTSSINSLAFALIGLKKLFKAELESPAIISFSSYDKFENFDFRNSKNSIVLISASTSGKLAKKLLYSHPSIKSKNIISLFYLSEDPTKSQVICDLTQDSKNFPDGVSTSDMYENEIGCKLCETGSYPVRITGDIFLLEKPKVEAIQLKKKDRPAWLNNYMRKFYSRPRIHLIRCFYGEEPKRRFEIYFKPEEVFSNIDLLNKDDFFAKEFTKKYIKLQHQIIPHSIKKIVYLDDEGSKSIAYRIKEEKKLDFDPISANQLLNLKEDDENAGAVLVICSCLATGNSLLYVNKYLRRFKNMSRTFFVVFARTEDDIAFEFTKSNICMGELGPNTNQLIIVEKANCSLVTEDPTELRKLSWSLEIELLKQLKDLAEEGNLQDALKYFAERMSTLEHSLDISVGGLINDVFLKNPINNDSLKINLSFAFFDFEEYHGNASQADIYFTIASVLNNLRNSNSKERRIIQEEHIRTILDPINFNRFDDGIIQAAILRAAKANELNYKLDESYSFSMMGILIKMIQNYQDKISSEGLVEFLFALSIKKLKIHDLHLKQILEKIDLVENQVLVCFSKYIRKEVYKK